jgi:hypothetical protein
MRIQPRSVVRSASVALLPMLLLHAAATVAHARQGSVAEAGEDMRRTAAAATAPALDFTSNQLRHHRVLQARLQTRFGIKRLFRERGIPYPAAEIFIRVFKRERTLELWVRPTNSDRFSLLKQYMVCALAGELGPKRSQGDGQTPEGFYEIDHFNPSSVYLLSLHLNYPNRSDRMLGGHSGLGGDIFIHGGCETEGCIAVTDEAIKELYWIGVEARASGQQRIPVHIFPARLTAEELNVLGRKFGNRTDLLAFWTSLKPGFDHFERTRQLPPIRIDAKGHYGLLGEIEATPQTAAARAR